jgi:hypothetical protein
MSAPVRASACVIQRSSRANENPERHAPEKQKTGKPEKAKKDSTFRVVNTGLIFS